MRQDHARGRYARHGGQDSRRNEKQSMAAPPATRNVPVDAACAAFASLPQVW